MFESMKLIKSAPVKPELSAIMMPTIDFIRLPACKFQRNTEEHAKKIRPALVKSIPEHQIVGAFELPDGTRCKANGHTRSMLWASGEIPMPKEVLVIISYPQNDEEMRERYYSYDNSLSTEDTKDKIYGASRALGVQFKSKMCQSGRFGNAFNMASPRNMKESFDQFEFWKNDLLALDQLGPTSVNFPNPIVAAFLLTYRKHGASVIPFWRSWAEQSGIKDHNGRDSVDTLAVWLSAIKKEGWGNYKSTGKILGITLYVIESWLTNPTTRYKSEKDLKDKQLDYAAYKREMGL